jgi:hypothetical protein
MFSSRLNGIANTGALAPRLSQNALIREFISEFRVNRMMRSGRWREGNKKEQNCSVCLFILFCNFGGNFPLQHSRGRGNPSGINGTQSGEEHKGSLESE